MAIYLMRMAIEEETKHGISGTPWQSVALHGTPMALNGTPWQSVAISSNQWHSMAINGQQRPSAALTSSARSMIGAINSNQ